jgi:methylglyoxal synthase
LQNSKPSGLGVHVFRYSRKNPFNARRKVALQRRDATSKVLVRFVSLVKTFLLNLALMARGSRVAAQLILSASMRVNRLMLEPDCRGVV